MKNKALFKMINYQIKIHFVLIINQNCQNNHHKQIYIKKNLKKDLE